MEGQHFFKIKSLEQIALEQVVSIASANLKYNWRVLPHLLRKEIAVALYPKLLHECQEKFSVVLEFSDVVVLAGRGRSKGKGRPRKNKNTYGGLQLPEYLDERWSCAQNEWW